ncbi:MAG TPA: Calx-beta domain-containing protein [Chitinophagaceae bacterium]
MKSLFLFLSISFYSALAFTQDPCASVNITGGTGQVDITGMSAPIAGIQIFNSSWASVFNQTYTNPVGSYSVSMLAPGQYFVNVRLYNANWSSICEKSATVTVTPTSSQPADICGATFQKTFGGLQGNDQAFNIVKSTDGGYIAVGQSAASGNTNNDGLVMKFDSKGALLWSKTLGGAQQDFYWPLVATPDGGCLAAGQTNSTGINTYSGDTWLVRYDAAGNVLWQKRYFISGYGVEITAITATTDGGFAFTGTVPFTPGLSDVMVVKTDANGNIIWQKKLGTGNSDSGRGILEDNTGGAGLIVSSVIYSGTWYDGVITKLDLVTGNIHWTKTYDFDSRTNWVRSITKVADGFIFNVLNVDGWGIDNAKPAILKTDFYGNLLWLKEYVIGNCREGEFTVLPDGGFMMALTELPIDGASDLHLMRIDPAGNIMWAKKYPRAAAQWLSRLITDGNYVVGAGQSTTGSYNDLLLAKADFNGKMGNCPSVTVNGVARNPVITNINFSWPINTSPGLTAANTVYTLTANTPVENTLCADNCPAVTISNATVSENAGNALLQVCISSPAATTLVYQYSTANGSATTGSDYTGGPGTVTIPAGQTCGTISIPIVNDADIESAENFTVSIGAVTGTVTINDDDQAQGNCNGLTFTPGNNQIAISGVTAAVATVQLFNSSWATVFNQTYTNAPGTVNVPIGPGTYIVKVTFYTSNWGYICDKSENVTVINTCPAGTICISNVCPTQTVNLNTAYTIPNLPAGTTVSWHTGTPATDANKMTDEQAQNVSVSGTYYAAINIAGAGCYSATIPVSVTIAVCSSPGITNAVQVKSEDQPAARNIMAFPNPFTSSLRVIIDSEKQEKAVIDVMDLQGRQLKQMPVQLMPGSNTVLLEGLDKYPSGNYFLRVSSGKGTKTLKVIRQQ